MIAQNKKALRKEISQIKELYSTEELADLSKEILAKLESTPEFKKAKTILLYYSLPDEVQTADFISKWGDSTQMRGKRLVLPVVNGDDLILKEYNPLYIKEGYKGIMEPTMEAITVDPSEIELAIIPGVAFDIYGRRLGRGKGFYDRFLNSISCPIWGIAFPFQIVEDIPVESFDKPVSKVIY